MPAPAARLSRRHLSCVDAADRPLWWATRRWPTKHWRRKMVQSRDGRAQSAPSDCTNFVGTIALRRTTYGARSTVAGSLATATSTFSSWLDRLPQRLRKNGQQTQHGCSARRCGWRSPCIVWPSARRCLVGTCPARASSHFFVRSHRLAATLIAQQLLRWSLVT